MKALHRGWYLGDATFADKLRALVKPESILGAGRDTVARSHAAAEAERLVVRALECLEMPIAVDSLSELRKGDERKVMVAVLLRKRTSVGNRWLAERLAMGHTGGVSRLLGTFRKSKERLKNLARLEEMLQ